jgi:ATP/maltotriose-dependent transcriptional regulator MalT/DNA-binding SARP family transcriptional activator
MDSSIPIIDRKIRAPRLPRTLCRRKRLVDLIHRHIERKLILVSASAGYGKTTLLAEYCHDTNLPVCWYTVDPYDVKLSSFVSYLVAALRTQFPDFGADLDFQSRLADIEALGRLLLSEIERIDQYFVLVLDDYHEVSESVAINSLMDLLLSYLPENCHILLSSRGIPTRLTLSRLAARQESFGLTAQDLAFTREEMRLLLAQLGRVDISEEQLDNLAERSEGWVTGILLHTQVELSSSAQDILRLTGSGQAVFAYLASEVLQQQTPEVQSFLLGSSILDEMTPATCNALLDITNSAEILSMLTRQALFTFTDGGGRSFVYHQLFHEFLRSELAKNPERFRYLGRQAGEIMAAEGDWATAVERYLQAEAYDPAASLLEMAAEQAFDEGYRAELVAWIDRLPDDLLARHPRLLFYRAKGYTESSDLDAAQATLEQVLAIGLKNDDAIISARALVQRAIIERLQLRFEAAISTCQLALELAPQEDTWSRLRALHNLGICRLMQADEGGLDDLREALAIAHQDADDTNAAYIAHDLGNALVRIGRLQEAQVSFNDALLRWRKAGNPADVALTLQGLGVISHYLGDYAGAEARLSDSFHKAAESNDMRLQAYALANLVELYRDLGRYDQVLADGQQAAEVAAQVKAPDLIAFALVMQADAYRLMGDLPQARQFAQEAVDQATTHDLHYETALATCALGMSVLRQDAGRAVELVTQGLADLEQHGSPRDTARAHARLGLIYLHLGQRDQARLHFGHASELINQLGSAQVLVSEGREGLDLLEQAQANGLCDFDLSAIRAVHQRTEDSPAVERDGPVPDISFLGLDGGLVLVRGEPAAHWESAVSREMAFLLATNPRGLRRDTIIEMLWPDSEPDKGNSLFHSTLYRVRRALGQDVVVRISGRYLLNPDLHIYSDAVLFEDLAKLALAPSGDATAARAQALAIYHEPYLASCELDWCYQVRERLRRLLIDLLSSEAHQAVGEGDYRRAEAAYQRLLDVDDLDEHAYRGIMWARGMRGEEAAATRVYMQCRKVLRRELGIDPEPTTKQLWEAIRRHDLLPNP